MSLTFYSIIEKAPKDSQVFAQNPSVELDCIQTTSTLPHSQQKHALYVGNLTKDFLELNPHGVNLLLYSDISVSSNPFADDCNVIFVYDLESFYRLSNIVIDMVNEKAKLSEINENFLDIVSSGGSIQKLLNYGCHVLENPLLMVDMSFRYIASAGTDNLEDEPTWKTTIERGIMPKDHLSIIMNKEVEYISSDFGKEGIIYDRPYINDSYDSYSIRVFHGGKLYGYLKLLEKYTEFTAFNHKVLMLLGKYAGILSDNLLQIYNLNENTAENLLTSILSGKIESDKAAGVLTTLSPAKFQKNLYLIGINFINSTDFDDELFYTHMKIKRFFSKHIVSIINGGYVVLYDTNLPDTEFFISEEFLTLLREIKCYANISLVFQELDKIEKFYQQSLFCEEYRKMFDCRDEVLMYKDIFEYQMILSMSDKIELSGLVHPIVYQLKIYDSMKDSGFTETLFAYVRNNLSITDTSLEMNFHYNTIKHRLEKIVELTSFDETDKSLLFQISMSEKILRIIDNLEK